MLEYSESSNHNESMTLQEVLTRHEAVFKEGLGTWTGPPAKIHVNKVRCQGIISIGRYLMLKKKKGKWS